jgi:hypothetical protein
MTETTERSMTLTFSYTPGRMSAIVVKQTLLYSLQLLSGCAAVTNMPRGDKNIFRTTAAM